MNLCLVCLRTDRLLKAASNTLQEFHDELCEFSVVTMSSSCYYCSECEYLLTKFYKFKEKCVKALNIYQKWMSAKSSKKHPKDLYTLLPPSPLGKWAPDSEKNGNLTLESEDLQLDLRVEGEMIRDAKEVKVEYDQIYSNDEIDTFADELKNENIKSEHIDKVSGSETEEQLFEKVDKLLEKLSDSVTSENVSTDPISVPKTEIRDKMTNLKKLRKKVTSKKKDKTTENLPKSKKLTSKTMTAKKRAYFEKFKENDKTYQSVFEIEYLTTNELKQEEFQRRKTYDHYVKAEHKCEICYQVVKSLKYLEYHMKKWHNESPGSVLCPICRTWNSKRSKHRRTHTVVYRCKLCPLVSYHRKSMQNHFEQHKGKQYHCEQCNITYKSNSAYRNHMGKVHRRGRNVCEGCGRGFGSPLGLKIHKNNSFRCTASKDTSLPTEAIDGVRCEDCDVTLPSQEVYEVHVSDVHEPKRQCRPLPVNSAGLPESRVVKSQALKSRKRTRRTPEHTCRVCNKVGVSFGWLQMHFRKEHPNEDIDVLYADKRTHLCDICGTGFSNVYALGAHMNLHTGARPHACDLCPKRFRSGYLLREHRVRHYPAAFRCAHCGKTFKTRANLYTHVKVHTGERDHKCDICGKGFVQRANLNEHVRGVHYNIRRVKRGGAREGADSAAGGGAKRRKTAAEGETDSDCGDSRE